VRSALIFGLCIGLIGFVPLFGGPRYEAALAAGLLGPTWCAVVVAWRLVTDFTETTRRSAANEGPTIVRCLDPVGSALVICAWHVMALLTVATLHGVRTGFCEPLEGYLLHMLGPGTGMALASTVAAICALLVVLVPGTLGRFRRLVAAILALIFPLGSALLGLVHFYRSPVVFAYDPFVGYFAGPLYDTVVYDLDRLLSFRAGTALSFLAIVFLLSGAVIGIRQGRRRILFEISRKEQALAAFLGLACGLGSVTHGVLAERMGHRYSAESIQEELGRFTKTENCSVFFAAGVDAGVAQTVARECVGHLDQLARYFGLKHGPAVTIYLFESSEQKRLLMGAADTYIAKPWRREIYLQPGDFPHQVLGHELAHVVAGEFGAGPLKVAGHFNGLLPDPGRIEGFAEAASPRENSEATLHEWTAAMKQLGLLPPLRSLFRLGFLGAAPAKSYSAAGSFVDFLREAYGAELLRTWYRGGNLETLTEKSWSDLEGEWLAQLEGIEVPKEVIEIARPKFKRPGVFERRCPHATDRAIASAHRYCPLQEKRARRFADEAQRLDPTQGDLDLSMARCAWAHGDAERSLKTLTELAQYELRYEPDARRGALDYAGNIAWNLGKEEQAARLYDQAVALAFRADTRRQIEVKKWALTQESAVKHALRLLMAPAPREAEIPLMALTQWAERGPHKDFAKYLLARVATTQGAHAEARRLLSDLDEARLPLPSLAKEKARMGVLGACRWVMEGGPSSELEREVAAYRKHALNSAEVRELVRVSERCRVAAEARKKAR
jgi:tetratricopeptide (TPR) repeat protein